MKMALLNVLSVIAALSAVAAPPKATVTAFTHNADNGEVSVSYTVDGTSIVTAEFLSSGEAIEPELYADRLVGTINREVTSGTTHSFRWAPDSVGGGMDLSGKSLEVRLTAWAPLSPPPYMALDLAVTNNVLYYASSNAVPGGVHDFRYKSDFLLMRRIPAKNVTWTMGVSSASMAYDTWSSPGLRKVKLTYDYYICVFQITQQQHQYLTGVNPSAFTADASVDGHPAYMGRPADCISYNAIRGSGKGAGWPNSDFDVAHAVDEGSAVHAARAVTGKLLDLPSEAEWEFACRAGCAADIYTGKWIETQSEKSSTAASKLVSRFLGNSKYKTEGFSSATILPDEGGTAIVGSYRPNAWGLYDMLGNLREWCLDYWTVGAQEPSKVYVDYAGPQQPTAGSRILKGGSYMDGAYICSAGNCSYTKPDTTSWPTGYRLCMIIK